MSKKRKLAVGDVEPEPSSHLRRSMRSAVLAGPLFPYKMSDSTQKGAVRSNLKTFDVILPLVFQYCLLTSIRNTAIFAVCVEKVAIYFVVMVVFLSIIASV